MISRFAAMAMLACAFAAPAAQAHTRSQSQSRWVIGQDTMEARVEADAVDVTRLYALGGEAPLEAMFAAEVGQAFEVSANGQRCTAMQPPDARIDPGGRVTARLQFHCPSGALAFGEVELESRLFLRVAPSHLHFVAIERAGARAEAVLTEGSPRAHLKLQAAAAAESFAAAFSRFLPIGAYHVWTGLDHVAFMLALVLFAGQGIGRAALAITGFTLGHTVTLALATIGALRPDQGAVEALIGFTIAFVALGVGDNAAKRTKAWSLPLAILLALGGVAAVLGWVKMSPLVWVGLAAFVLAYPRGMPRHALWLAAAFGLIHGCGFAGGLGELGLPRPRLVAALLGFNVGVELGQLTVIVAALAVGALLRRWLTPNRRANLAQLAGAALFALGCFWFAARLEFG